MKQRVEFVYDTGLGCVWINASGCGAPSRFACQHRTEWCQCAAAPGTGWTMSIDGRQTIVGPDYKKNR